MPVDWNRDPYAAFLRGQGEKVFYVYPYRGNSGDVLIRMGTLDLLSSLRIRTTVDPRKAGIILWPGGNPSMWQSNVLGWADLLDRHRQAEFVVGPATFRFSGPDWKGVLAKNADRVCGLFARDPESFENLLGASLPPGIPLGLSHDPALFLEDSAWLREHRAAATQEYILISLRDDHEAQYGGSWRFFSSFGKLLPAPFPEYWDALLSRLIARRKAVAIARKLDTASPVIIRDAAKDSFDFFIETLRRASEVHTDRLHVMLLSVMLGKRVFAYPTSYGKLEAVYRHSLLSAAGTEVTFIER